MDCLNDLGKKKRKVGGGRSYLGSSLQRPVEQSSFKTSSWQGKALSYTFRN